MFNVGDKVWSPIGGWGVVTYINNSVVQYPIHVEWSNPHLHGITESLRKFTKCGKVLVEGEQVLFKHQLNLSTAKKVISIPPVDTLVKVHGIGDDCYRYSSGAMRGDSLVVYMAGRTSKTAKCPDDVFEYYNWEIVQ